jgi:branched-chain amino acid transport system permease protein
MRRHLALLAIGIALVAVPFATDGFHLVLVTRGLVWAIFALSVWLPLRVLNLPSFGHAAFFGVAAYSAGLAVTRWGIHNIFVAVGVSVAITCLVALPIGVIASRLNSVSFLLITLAFAEMLRSLALRWRELGGSDGLVGVIRPRAWPLPVNLTEPVAYFYLTLSVLAVCVLVLVVLTRSPAGGVLVGIREGEGRMRALGYRVPAYKTFAFLVSAAIAATAGVLQAYLNRFVSPEELSALVSARGLLIVVLAGTQLWASVAVAVALTVGEDQLSSQTQHWLAVIGLIFVVVALLRGDDGRRVWARLAGGRWHRGEAGRPAEET